MRAFRIGIAVAMLVGASDRSWADEGPLVTKLAATSQELRDDGAHPTYHVPLVLASGVAAADLACDVTQVAVGALYDGAMIDAFTPSIDVATGRPRLAIAVDFARFTQPGAYAVEIELTGKAPPAPGGDAGVAPTPPRQTVVVTLTHPGATLRPTGTWIIWRTRRVFGDPTLAPARFPLGETARRSRLTPVTIQQHDSARHGDEAVSGTLEVTVPSEIKLGTIGAATVAVRGDFPIGTTKGELELRAPQLAAPVVISYEVRSRYPGWYVIPIFFFAGLLGWFFRVYLKGREEQLAQTVQADDVLLRLDEEKTGHPVPAQSLALDEAQRELVRALADGDAATITAAITKAATALTTATASRAQARSDLVTDARAQAELLGRPWVLPPEFALGRLQASFVAIAEHAMADRMADAKAARAVADDTVAQLLVAANRWATRVRGLCAAIEAPPAPIPAALATAWTAIARTMRDALDAIPKPTPGTPTAASGFLPPLHAAHEATLAGVDQLAAGLRALAAPIADQLGASDDAQAHAATITRAVALDDAGVATDAERGLPLVAAATRALAQAVRDAIAALFAPADPAAVEALLAAGTYLEAVRASKPAPMGQRRDVSARDTIAELVRTTARRLGVVAPTAGTSGVVVVMPSARGAIVARRARELRVLLWARAMRGALSLVIATGGAYLLYGGSFVGTATEIAALIATAFTTEFTIEHSLEVLGRSAPRGG